MPFYNSVWRNTVWFYTPHKNQKVVTHRSMQININSVYFRFFSFAHYKKTHSDMSFETNVNFQFIAAYIDICCGII